jgi:hypothetical protein
MYPGVKCAVWWSDAIPQVSLDEPTILAVSTLTDRVQYTVAAHCPKRLNSLWYFSPGFFDYYLEADQLVRTIAMNWFFMVTYKWKRLQHVPIVLRFIMTSFKPNGMCSFEGRNLWKACYLLLRNVDMALNRWRIYSINGLTLTINTETSFFSRSISSYSWFSHSYAQAT